MSARPLTMLANRPARRRHAARPGPGPGGSRRSWWRKRPPRLEQASSSGVRVFLGAGGTGLPGQVRSSTTALAAAPISPLSAGQRRQRHRLGRQRQRLHRRRAAGKDSPAMPPARPPATTALPKRRASSADQAGGQRRSACARRSLAGLARHRWRSRAASAPGPHCGFWRRRPPASPPRRHWRRLSASSAVSASASRPLRPLMPASTVIGSPPYSASAPPPASRAASRGNSPSEAASCRRTLPAGVVGLLQHRRRHRGITLGQERFGAAHSRPGAHKALVSSSAWVTVSRIQRAHARQRPDRLQPGVPVRRAVIAICFKAGTTDLSLRWTSNCCAVSRHQPFGSDRCATSWAGVSSIMCGLARAGFMPVWTTRQMRPLWMPSHNLCCMDVVLQVIALDRLVLR